MIYSHQIQVGDLLRFTYDGAATDPIIWCLSTKIEVAYEKVGMLPASYAFWAFNFNTMMNQIMFIMPMGESVCWDLFRDGKGVQPKKLLPSKKIEL